MRKCCIYRPCTWLRRPDTAISFCLLRKNTCRRAAFGDPAIVAGCHCGPGWGEGSLGIEGCRGEAQHETAARSWDGQLPLHAELQSQRFSCGSLFVEVGRRELAELDAHLVERMPQQLEPPNAVGGILAELPETLDRERLLLYAQLHPANMHQRGISIG
jgi:hypothetical protein